MIEDGPAEGWAARPSVVDLTVVLLGGPEGGVPVPVEMRMARASEKVRVNVEEDGCSWETW